jgi:hypothetical protein
MCHKTADVNRIIKKRILFENSLNGGGYQENTNLISPWYSLVFSRVPRKVPGVMRNVMLGIPWYSMKIPTSCTLVLLVRPL